MCGDTFDRFTRIVRSHVDGFLDQLEDPEKMIHQAIRDMEETIDQAVEAVAAAVANQRRLEKQEVRARAGIQQWQEKAEQAVKAGDEPRARQALEQKSRLARSLEALAPVLEEARETSGQLRARLEEMQQRLQEAKKRRGNLIARHRATCMESSRRPEPFPAGPDPFARFERIEQQVRAREAELARFAEQVDAAEAEAELYQEMSAALRTERALEEKERERQVEEELAALRRRMEREE